MVTTITRNSIALAILIFLAVGAQAAGVLTAKNGMTLYGFDKDKGGQSSCYGLCAYFWPPYMGTQGEKKGKPWTLVKQTNGKMQWAYHGRLLYFYSGDNRKGDMMGDGKEGVWHVVRQ